MNSQKPRLTKIARDLELSITTVSRVLRNRPDVNPETRKRVLEYVQTIGYQTKTKLSELPLIGVVDTFRRHLLSSYYDALILEGVDEKLYESGFLTTIIHTELIEREQGMYDNVRVLNQLSGIIWLEPLFNPHYLQIVSNHGIPCVVINSCEQGVQVDLVECNSFKAAKMATEYLLGLGHRAIAFIGGQLSYPNILDRLKGYTSALAEAGVELDQSLVVDDISLWNDEGGVEGVYRLFSRKRTPTAILLSSDFLVNGVYRAIKELGYSIPRDISVISFDDSPFASYLDPPVTSCQQPLKHMGSTAAERLVRMIEARPEDRSPQTISVNMHFIVRRSTGPAPSRSDGGRDARADRPERSA